MTPDRTDNRAMRLLRALICPHCGRTSATPLLAQLHAARCSEEAAQREFAMLIRRAAAAKQAEKRERAL